MLAVDDVAPFLVKRELLEERLIVDGNVLVVHVPRRNHNFTIVTEPGAGYFLKQGLAAENIETVRHEADIYRWFESLAEFNAVKRYLPTCRLYDPDERALVLTLIEGSHSLASYHPTHRGLPRALGRALGEALGTIHRVTRAATAAKQADRAGRAARFLNLHRPDYGAFIEASFGMMEVVKAIQQSAELCQMLDEVAQDWREDAVIHGDLRWDNCQVLDPPSPGRPFGVTFVDWEAAGVGDACWDVGTVFSQCLVFWLLSTPLLRDRPPEAFAGLARSPLTRIRPAMRAFWRAYLRASKLETGVHGECLWRSMRYAGARLVQTAYEQMRWEIELTADMIYLLQLSLNVLHRPLEAAVQLLGIPVVSGAVR